jgi:predicted Zn-dependent protease with MMP-like domain
MAGKLRGRISPVEFEEVVEQALESLPSEFQDLLENIAVVVEEEPSPDDLDSHDSHDEELLGLFRGVPRTQATTNMLPMLPNRIAIFRGPILRMASSREEAIEEIRKTVIHELGHYFGLDDAGMSF